MENTHGHIKLMQEYIISNITDNSMMYLLNKTIQVIRHIMKEDGISYIYIEMSILMLALLIYYRIYTSIDNNDIDVYNFLENIYNKCNVNNELRSHITKEFINYVQQRSYFYNSKSAIEVSSFIARIISILEL